MARLEYALFEKQQHHLFICLLTILANLGSSPMESNIPRDHEDFNVKYIYNKSFQRLKWLGGAYLRGYLSLLLTIL